MMSRDSEGSAVLVAIIVILVIVIAFILVNRFFLS